MGIENREGKKFSIRNNFLTAKLRKSEVPLQPTRIISTHPVRHEAVESDSVPVRAIDIKTSEIPPKIEKSSVRKKK